MTDDLALEVIDDLPTPLPLSIGEIEAVEHFLVKVTDLLAAESDCAASHAASGTEVAT